MYQIFKNQSQYIQPQKLCRYQIILIFACLDAPIRKSKYFQDHRQRSILK